MTDSIGQELRYRYQSMMAVRPEVAHPRVCSEGDHGARRLEVSVTDSATAEHAVSLETSNPCAPLASIVLTEELRRRPSRPPDYEKENRALAALVGALADSPRTILQTLADKILEVLQAGSAGLSLLTKDKTRFYWAAIAGAWAPHIGGGTPRNFGPCGDVLDRNVPMLFTHWEKRYPYLGSATPLADEGLLVPFYVNGRSVGTIWAIVHDRSKQFDSEDQRLLESLGRFASAAYQALDAIDSLKLELDSNKALEREIAERTRAEQELRRNEVFLEEAERLSQIGGFSWRVATDEVTWSNQLYRIYEVEIGVPVTPELIRARVHPEDASLIDRMKIVHAAGDGSNHFEWHYRLVMPDRSIKYLHAVGHATRDQHGQLEYIAAVRDVTARRRSEEALDKARSELARVARALSFGALTASIAHEVNQPLAGIITNASTCLRMLDADPPDLAGARETARRTIRDGNRAADVIGRLRSLFGKRETAADAVDLNQATREVIALSASELQRHQIVLRTDLTSHLPPVSGDRVQLQQVILNLLLNASDAMDHVDDRPRQVVIRTEREEGNRVRLTVRDSGVGFDRQSADRLFEMFFTTKGGGMGIGLSVSRSIIEGHRGRLWATPNDGPGASFSFSIPCRHQVPMRTGQA